MIKHAFSFNKLCDILKGDSDASKNLQTDQINPNYTQNEIGNYFSCRLLWLLEEYRIVLRKKC